jgi:hypothetical protein
MACKKSYKRKGLDTLTDKNREKAADAVKCCLIVAAKNRLPYPTSDPGLKTSADSS